MRSLRRTAAGENTQKHGDDSESERCESERERGIRSGQADGGRDVRTQLNREVDAVAEQPHVHSCPPEHEPLDGEPEVSRPEYRQRHERNADADGDNKQRLEGGE